MQQELRLTGKKDFSSAQKEGRRLANRLLVLRFQESGLPRSRFGFSVGRRVGTAVRRNAVKRRLRASVQSIPVRGGWDAVFIVRSAAATASFQELKEAVKGLLGQAGLIAPEKEKIGE